METDMNDPINHRPISTGMTPQGDLNSPWGLHFERDGTEDIAVISDADGEEILRSRPFWLPEAGDPVPLTLAAMRLIVAAPELLAELAGISDAWSDADGGSEVMDYLERRLYTIRQRIAEATNTRREP
jgi:hypothetical protein